MFIRTLVICVVLVLFYWTTDSLFGFPDNDVLLVLIFILAMILGMLGPSLLVRERKIKGEDEPEVVDRNWNDGEYHNDFSRVGSAEQIRDVKPIDQAGNAMAHAQESFNEDMNAIGLADNEGEKSEENKD